MIYKKKILFEYEELSSANELPEEDRSLIKLAIEAKNNAYAPYSNFKVGTALRFIDDTEIIGSNQENAAYPSGLCAERVALYYANSQYPNKIITKLAIAGGPLNNITQLPISPCGSCRQTLLESENRQKHPIELILIGEQKIWKIKKASELSPLAFDNNELD